MNCIEHVLEFTTFCTADFVAASHLEGRDTIESWQGAQE